MQNLKPRFQSEDGGALSTLQSCIRTNDLDLVGDGTHLTYFEMLGNFSFHGTPYSQSVEMWDAILTDFNLKQDCVIHVHEEGSHETLWKEKGYEVVQDPECVWSDGNVGGYSSEVYHKGVEIGNLVNPLSHSTDVGFGWERLLAVLECKERVDESSIFDQTLSPVMRDHVRTINCLWDHGIEPGNKGRNYVCRRLIRRCLSIDQKVKWDDWLQSEIEAKNKAMRLGVKLLRKHKDKDYKWWWETTGLLSEEVDAIRG